MGRPYQILIPLLSLFLVRVDLTDFWPLHYKVQVLEILDGDTLVLGLNQRRIKLRISKIDAPEKGQPFIDGSGNAGMESSGCLKSLLTKYNAYTLTITGVDIYGRNLGDINELSYELIRNGCATIYPYATFKSKHEKFQYMRALGQAKSTHVGLWARGGFMIPKVWRKLHRHQRK